MVRGGQRQLAADRLGDRGQRLQRPPEPVVVQKHDRHAEQLGDRRRGRPAGHVIQRCRRGEPVGDQRGDHLPVGQLRAARIGAARSTTPARPSRAR